MYNTKLILLNMNSPCRYTVYVIVRQIQHVRIISGPQKFNTGNKTQSS